MKAVVDFVDEQDSPPALEIESASPSIRHMPSPMLPIGT